jgi:DUF1680 family protein
MLKSAIVFLLLLFVFRTDLRAQNTDRQVVKDALFPAQQIKLKGYLAEKLDGSLKNRILAQDVDRLVAAFKPENRTETHLWQTEFWGKWFTSAVLAYKYKPDPELKKVLDHAVDGLLANQTPDGYIGNYAKEHRLEQWDIWGRKYCMLGLLAYYDITKDKKSLVGASRVADNLMDDLNKSDGLIVNKGNYRGMAASSVLEPICLLYNDTGNKKYLDFAKEIVREWETPQGPHLVSNSKVNVSERFPKPGEWYSYEQGQKAYEMMSCYEGLLELYRITGNETYKTAVENVWQNILDTEINVAGSGASTEMWFGGKAVQNTPINHYQETCVSVTWLKLTDQLLRLTGDAKYADEAEKTYYNAILGAMSANGAMWAKYTPLNGERLPGGEQCAMGINCCEASGPRGLFNYPLHMVMTTKSGLQVNYFADGAFILKTPGGQKLTLTQHTDYPISGTVKMDIDMPKAEEMTINIRIPYWSKATALFVNGEVVTNLQPGQNASIKRVWKAGDKISLILDFRGRVERIGTTLQSVAILRGPIVLARDSRYEGPALEAIMKPVTDEQGFITLTPVASDKKGAFMAFKANFIPESYTENEAMPLIITLCDYASAGYGIEHSFYKVWSPQIIDPRD